MSHVEFKLVVQYEEHRSIFVVKSGFSMTAL